MLSPHKMTILAALVLTVIASAEGIVFTKCGLAEELLKLHVPKNDLPKWVCMAEHESSFNTAALNTNSDHSKDHGIFQINDYWNCDPRDGRTTKNGCGHPCSDFMDQYLTDDVACINKLIREHHGFGFSYGYTSHCSSVSSSYLSDCGAHVVG